MLQSLFSLFLPHKRRNDEKMARLIQTLRPTKTVRGLVVRTRLEMSTTEWVEILSDVESDEQRLVDLDRCFIDKVDHVRKDSKDSKDIHEKVGFTFHLASADKSEVSAQVGREDSRAACVQRLTADHPSEPGR
jgi:predicted polyphosphate/ATP-dependent NAD kinase